MPHSEQAQCGIRSTEEYRRVGRQLLSAHREMLLRYEKRENAALAPRATGLRLNGGFDYEALSGELLDV